MKLAQIALVWALTALVLSHTLATTLDAATVLAALIEGVY